MQTVAMTANAIEKYCGSGSDGHGEQTRSESKQVYSCWVVICISCKPEPFICQSR